MVEHSAELLCPHSVIGFEWMIMWIRRAINHPPTLSSIHADAQPLSMSANNEFSNRANTTFIASLPTSATCIHPLSIPPSIFRRLRCGTKGANWDWVAIPSTTQLKLGGRDLLTGHFQIVHVDCSLLTVSINLLLGWMWKAWVRISSTFIRQCPCARACKCGVWMGRECVGRSFIFIYLFSVF